MSEAHIQCTERCLALEAERDSLRQQAGNVLAVIHCDGGHKTEEIGFAASCELAIKKRNEMVLTIDMLREQVRVLRGTLVEIVRKL